METLLTNAIVLTMDADRRVARQIRILDGRIAEVGDNLAVGDGAQVIDLGGKTVLPGFADCHTHLLYGGCRITDLGLDACRSTDELLDLVAAARRANPAVVRGWNLNDAAFTDGAKPGLADLNRVSATTPIILSRIGNGAALLNQAAFDAVELDPGVPGLEILDGFWTGWVWGEAGHRALDYAIASLTDSEIGAAASAAAGLAIEQGVTTLHAIEGSFAGQGEGARGRDNARLDRLRPHLAGLPITVVPLDSQLDSPADMERIAQEGGRFAGGDLFLDGVLGAAFVPGMARAALDEPYADGLGGNGHLLLNDDLVREYLTVGARHGVSLGAHAVGERSIAQFLDAWEAVVTTDPDARSLRPRIDHGILPRKGDITRAAELGVMFSMQPVFESRSGGPDGMYARRVGPDRVRETHPFRELKEAGVLMVGGSDSPVNPVHPLDGIRAAVNHSNPDQRLGLFDAVAMFTINAAYAAYREEETGSIEPGKIADLTMLSHDPRPRDGLAHCEVVETWHKGQMTYRRADHLAQRGAY